MKNIFICFVFILCNNSYAMLCFDSNKHFFEIPQDIGVYKYAFKFRNNGNENVKILRISTDCGCTAALSDKNDYSAGDVGKIDVSFEIGDRKGKQNKRVIVQTDDGANPLYVLELNLKILPDIELAPRLLLWKQGGKNSALTSDIRIASEKLGKCDIALADTFNDFDIILEKEKNICKVTVTPKTTDKAIFRRLKIRFLTKSKTIEKEIVLYLKIA